MHDDSGAKGMNPMLEKHWEKLVLGAVIALGIVYFAMTFSGGGNAAAKGINTLRDSVAAKKAASNSRIEAPKPLPEPKISAPASGDAAPAFAIGRKTVFAYDFKERKGPEATQFLFPKLTLNPPVPSPTSVELSWSIETVTADPAKKQQIVVKPTTFYYRIERATKGVWSILVKDHKAEQVLKYVDTKTDPKAEYEYKVTLCSNDLQFAAKNRSEVTDKVGGPLGVRTPGIWAFSFANIQADPDADKPVPGTAYVTIQKYDRDFGLVEWKKIQKEGEFLGVIMDGTQEVTKHRVSDSKGKTVVVDLKSGAQIKKIIKGRVVPYAIKKCKQKPDGMGGLACDGPEPVKDLSYRVNEVIYTDEDGKVQTFQSPDGPPQLTDELCPLHGGPPPAKELTAEEKAAKHEEDAAKLLDEADALWDSAKPGEKQKAQEKYKKLLESFSDTAAMKTRKYQVGERVKEKLK